MPPRELVLAGVCGALSLAAFAAGLAGVEATAVFALAAAAVIPTAYLMGIATEEIAKRAGPGIGGLLNATFGNATELIIALFALSAGLVEIVKASITGSIIGNVLLVLGISMVAGGWRHKKQTFTRSAVQSQSTMMFLAIAALLMPSLYLWATAPQGGSMISLRAMSVAIAGLLLIGYVLGLLFSLHTHRDLFNPVEEEPKEPGWSLQKSLGLLVLAGVFVGFASEALVKSVEGSIVALGLNELFVGVIIVAAVGNAAEHSGAVLMAWRNRMDLSVGIAVASSTQVALFLAPVLVLASYALGNPMNLAFEVFELLSIALAIGVVALVAHDGESNWFEGAMLVLVYAVIALGFFYHP